MDHTSAHNTQLWGDSVAGSSTVGMTIASAISGYAISYPPGTRSFKQPQCSNSHYGPVGTERWEQYKARWAPELARLGFIVDWHRVQQRAGICIQKKTALRFRVKSKHGWNLDL